MQGFNDQASRDYHEVQAKQAELYLKKVLEQPDQFEQLMLAYVDSVCSLFCVLDSPLF